MCVKLFNFLLKNKQEKLQKKTKVCKPDMGYIKAH